MTKGKHKTKNKREKTRRRRALVFVKAWVGVSGFEESFAMDSDIRFSLVWMRVVKRLLGRCRVISTNNWLVRMFFFFVFKQVDKSSKGFNSNWWFVTGAIVVCEGFGGGVKHFRGFSEEFDTLGDRNFFIHKP